MSVFADVTRACTATVQQRNLLFDGPDYVNVGEPGQYLRRLKRLT